MNSNAPANGLTLSVTDTGMTTPGGNVLVDFTFRALSNTDLQGMSAVWFDDRCTPTPPLLTLADIIGDNSNGHVVTFSPGASPGDPPNSSNVCPDFVTTDSFSADADSGSGCGGGVCRVDPGEFLTVRFSLQTGKTYCDVINCMQQARELPAARPGCVDAQSIAGLRVAVNLDFPGQGSSAMNGPCAFIGGDCDEDGTPDECELSCSGAGGFCDIFPDCGGSTDCNTNDVPDECEMDVCDDGDPCTADSCNSGACVHTPIPGCCNDSTDCDDGLFCNGEETCVGGVCVDGPDPCPPGTTCNEESDTCDPTGACCGDFQNSCAILSEVNCNDANGEYLGDGTTCDQDGDSDGVSDCIDCCPSSPPGAIVDETGCQDVGANAGGPYRRACPDSPVIVAVPLNGSRSGQISTCDCPEGTLTVEWTIDCPGITILNANQDNAMLQIDTSITGCPLDCDVTLTATLECAPAGEATPTGVVVQQASATAQVALFDDCNGNAIDDASEVDSDGDGIIDDCEEEPVPQPTPPGACCFPDATCASAADATACSAAGGVFAGAGTDCSTTSCECGQPGGVSLLFTTLSYAPVCGGGCLMMIPVTYIGFLTLRGRRRHRHKSRPRCR
ncbi:MAG TPA: hypothetical protein VJZ71_01375 [Phycisphaerae bacterium]|nr:hypothetical protein [Phycisphaerae bacterium]